MPADGASGSAPFFVLPLVTIGSLSLMTGNSIDGFTLTWNFSVFPDAIYTYATQFGRSFLYGVVSTAVALLVMYPVAYWIAFHGGRHKSALLLLLLLPFFVSFVIRILRWQFILADQGIVLGTLKDIGLLPENLHVLSTPFAVIAGLTYDALPFMALPIYVALERIDRSLSRGGADLYASPVQRFTKVILPLSAPGRLRGDPARRDHQHRRLRERGDPGRPEHDDDRQHHPDPVRPERRLPGRVGAGADPDGRPARRDVPLCAGVRHAHDSGVRLMAEPPAATVPQAHAARRALARARPARLRRRS